MMRPKQSLFRQESLERLSSPERLDQLLQVVAPQDWMALASVGSLVLLVVAWSVFGRIPITVEGRGVLVYPHQILDVQAANSGKIQTVKVKVGDRVRKGDVLATIDQSALQEQLRQQLAKLAELQRQDQQLGTLTQQRLMLDAQVIQQQRQALLQRLQSAQDLDPTLTQRLLQTIQQQRQTLQQRLQNARDLSPILKQRLEQRQVLRSQGAISTDLVLEADQAYRDNLTEISSLQAQAQELESRETETIRNYRTSYNQLTDLHAQLQNLDSQTQGLAQQQVESAVTRHNQIQEVRQKITQLTLQVQTTSQILSQSSGVVIEMNAQPGQVVAQRERLGAIQADSVTEQLVSLTYVPIKDGQQIQVGMQLQITPDTVKREQFGGILGTVKAISRFSVTKQSMVSAIGNEDVVNSLVYPGGQLEVQASLTPMATPSGYQWSVSQGPAQKISPGTPTTVKITIAEQAPIVVILPLLRSLMGAN